MSEPMSNQSKPKVYLQLASSTIRGSNMKRIWKNNKTTSRKRNKDQILKLTNAKSKKWFVTVIAYVKRKENRFNVH